MYDELLMLFRGSFSLIHTVLHLTQEKQSNSQRTQENIRFAIGYTGKVSTQNVQIQPKIEAFFALRGVAWTNRD